MEDSEDVGKELDQDVKANPVKFVINTKNGVAKRRLILDAKEPQVSLVWRRV